MSRERDVFKGPPIVDTSIYQGPINGNIMSIPYRIDEKGVDQIKEDNTRLEI